MLDAERQIELKTRCGRPPSSTWNSKEAWNGAGAMALTMLLSRKGPGSVAGQSPTERTQAVYPRLPWRPSPTRRCPIRGLWRLQQLVRTVCDANPGALDAAAPLDPGPDGASDRQLGTTKHPGADLSKPGTAVGAPRAIKRERRGALLAAHARTVHWTARPGCWMMNRGQPSLPR